MIRITAGEWRGRAIRIPRADGPAEVRPSQAKLRQALFNSLQLSIPDARILDLFAGSGTLGLEALSRGASHVTFVESARICLKLLSENLEDFKATEQAEVIGRDVELYLAHPSGGPFDVVLADPPYAGGWEMKLLERLPWDTLLTEGGIFCLEWGKHKSKIDSLPDEMPFLVKIREKNYGDSLLTTYRRKPQASTEGP